jgi:O-antigen/teichoic acid export membrane protein
MGGLINKLKKSFAERDFREVLSGSSSAMVLKVVGLALTYLFTLFVTRWFGAASMGAFALALTLIQITAILSRAGFDSALIRFVAELTAQGNPGAARRTVIRALGLALPLSIALSFGLFVSSGPLAAQVFHNPGLKGAFQLAALALVPFVFSTLMGESLRGLKKIKHYMLVISVLPYGAGCLVLPFLLKTDRVQTAPLMAYAAGAAVAGIVGLAFWKRFSRTEGRPEAAPSLKKMLDVSLPMLLTSSFLFLYHWTDTIMLGMFRPEDEVGVYAVALRVANLTSLPLFAINAVAAPKFAEFYGTGNNEGIRRVALQSTKLLFWTSLPALLLIFILPGFVLGMFGHEFRAGVTPLLLLTVGQFFNAISGSVGAILNMTGREKVLRNIIVLAAGLNIVLNYLLIPPMGMTGAALASMTSVIFWNLFRVILVRKYYGFWTLYLPLPGLRR